MHRTLPRKLMYRPRAGIPRAKWLKKFKQKEDLKAATRFIEKNIKKCYKTAVGRYFLKDYPITLTQVYQNWYSMRLCNNWKDFNI